MILTLKNYIRTENKQEIMENINEIKENLEKSLKPYANSIQTYASLPESSITYGKILEDMKKMKEREMSSWKDGYVSGSVYHGDSDHIKFADKVYSMFSQTNPLHADIWPSMGKFESEIISMTAHMLGVNKGTDKQKKWSKQVCGTISSGGTESILLAMKVYRDRGYDKKITEPEIIVPESAHAAFDKAAQYFKIKIIHIPLDEEFRANVAELEKAITKNTVAIVGTAGTFPHGVIDPIEEMAEIARKNKIGFHVDACLGGFILPWAEKLGYEVPLFDFRVRGVTSISADTHKYGYANKGTSVILYRTPKLRRYQYYANTEWCGGIYLSPTFSGSRPGALVAICYATMVSLGEEGYLKATKSILDAADKIKHAISDIPELFVLGKPLWNIALGSKELNIFQVMDFMTKKNWVLNGLQKPSAIHICLTQRHAQPGVAERFIADIKDAIEFVKKNPEEKGESSPIYGMVATVPDRKLIGEFLKMYLDFYFTV
jgi:sphinganine-1-phosphate aldolase